MWRWAAPLHSLERTWRRTGLASVHSLDITLHIIWSARVPHYTSVLYVVGLACPGTCDAVNEGYVVGPAEVDMTQNAVIWLDGMLRDSTVSAVCLPLDVTLSGAVLVDSLEENAHLPHLCCAPLDLLKGHAMLYDGGSVSIANTVVMYMQWCSCHSPPYWYVISLSYFFISV